MKVLWGFPGGASGKEYTCQCRRHKRHKFDPLVQKIPWNGKGQPILVFLPRKSHRQKSLAGYSPWSQRVGYDWVTDQKAQESFDFVTWEMERDFGEGGARKEGKTHSSLSDPVWIFMIKRTGAKGGPNPLKETLWVSGNTYVFSGKDCIMTFMGLRFLCLLGSLPLWKC